MSIDKLRDILLELKLLTLLNRTTQTVSLAHLKVKLPNINEETSLEEILQQLSGMSVDDLKELGCSYTNSGKSYRKVGEVQESAMKQVKGYCEKRPATAAADCYGFGITLVGSIPVVDMFKRASDAKRTKTA